MLSSMLEMFRSLIELVVPKEYYYNFVFAGFDCSLSLSVVLRYCFGCKL